jgi:hypothetical protein
VAGSWIRRLIQAVVSGIFVGGVYALLVVSVYVGFLVVFAGAFVPDPGCRSFLNCTGAPVNDPLSQLFSVLVTPGFDHVLLALVVLIGALLTFAVIAIAEVLVWNGRRGWWWRSLLGAVPALLALLAAVYLVIRSNDYTLAGAAPFGVLAIMLTGSVLTAVVTGLLPSNGDCRPADGGR